MYNFALIGCGRIAPKHATEMLKHGRITAVCDIEIEKAEKLAKEYGARPYTSAAEMLDKENGPDIVAVCTPNGLHPEHAIMSLESGAHVLCEKPLAISSRSAKEMIETAKKCGKKLFVVKSTRYNPALQALKELVSENTFGKLYSFQLNCFWNRPAEYYRDSWRGKAFPDGGTLYTQFSHYIDAMLWLFGEVRSFSGYRKNLAHTGVIEFEDSGVISMEMSSGMLGGLNWSVNAFNKNMEISLSLLAENGCLRIGGEYLQEIEYSQGVADRLQVPAGQVAANDYGTYKGSMSNHDKVYENMLLALKDESHPFASAADGLKSVELIERIYDQIPLPDQKSQP